jgi:hypothetical protein
MMSRFLAAVEAYCHYVKILPEIKSQRLHRTDQALQQFTAQHRAGVVAEVQNDGTPVAKVVGELN